MGRSEALERPWLDVGWKRGTLDTCAISLVFRPDSRGASRIDYRHDSTDDLMSDRRAESGPDEMCARGARRHAHGMAMNAHQGPRRTAGRESGNGAVPTRTRRRGRRTPGARSRPSPRAIFEIELLYRSIHALQPLRLYGSTPP
eukprot:5126919-Prymnesium_polylepis.1